MAQGSVQPRLLRQPARRQVPALYSSDFGDVGTTNLGDRQRVVDNAKAYAQKGSIIQLHNHMIQPDQPDGAGFDVMHAFNGDYSRSNIDKMLTSGDSLNTELLRRIDGIAGYLGQLKDAGIAVLWRPYHEMNGGWFWWASSRASRISGSRCGIASPTPTTSITSSGSSR